MEKPPEPIGNAVPSQEAAASPEQQEKMVEAVKISTIFPHQKVLERIADKLLSEGVISGFHIDQTLGGYIFGGKKVEENQYSLEILLEKTAGDEIKEKIKAAISEAIGKEWEVPAIEEETVTINEKLLNFIKRAEIEHKKFVFERKKKLTVALAGLLSLGTALAVLSERYLEHREQEISQVERKKAHDKVEEMLQKVQDQVRQIELNEFVGKHLTVSPNTEMAVTYEETSKIMETIYEVEFEMRKLAKSASEK